MPIYKVTLTYKYTEEVVVEAENEREAERIAYSADTTRNDDDSLYDVMVREYDDNSQSVWYRTD